MGATLDIAHDLAAGGGAGNVLIGLQVHGGGKSEASYKNITIEELP